MFFQAVERAEMNFALRTVAVVGSASSAMLINAVEQAGYNAKTLSNESETDVLEENFPGPEHSFTIPDEEWNIFLKRVGDLDQ